jgi:hypothetical protein
MRSLKESAAGIAARAQVRALTCTLVSCTGMHFMRSPWHAFMILAHNVWDWQLALLSVCPLQMEADTAAQARAAAQAEYDAQAAELAAERAQVRGQVTAVLCWQSVVLLALLPLSKHS